MKKGVDIRRSFRRARIIAAIVFVVVTAVAVGAVVYFWGERAERQLRAKAAETLAVQSEALIGILDKYRLLPPLLSKEPSVVALFDDTDGDSAAARRKTIEIYGMSGAKEVALFYPDGTVLATARDLFANYAPDQGELLEAARQGRLGRQAITLDDGLRIYGFASGVWRDGVLLGILAVYVDFDPVEATWSLSANPIFVTDSNDTVFLSNRPQWRIRPLSALVSESRESGELLVGSGLLPHGDLIRDLPVLQWQLHVLSDQRPAVAARWTAGVIAALVCILLGGVGATLIQRREMQVLRMRHDRATALRLERLVSERTRALSDTNLSLTREIEERRQTEDRLRKTQAELVQAAKMAALGQMSAALNHEFNQPLAAMQTYADNAKRFLEQDRTDQVAENLTRIGGLVERMASLSRSLLSFSRKPGTQVRAVPLGPILDEALMLTRPRASKAGVSLNLQTGEVTTEVLGGHIRLSQVFVNLINNAVDAAQGGPSAQVRIGIEENRDDVMVRVEDSGQGVDAARRDAIFEPFYTTKDAGAGIGIGLSIVSSILQAFDGRIELDDSDLGGARFTVHLRAAGNKRMAAE